MRSAAAHGLTRKKVMAVAAIAASSTIIARNAHPGWRMEKNNADHMRFSASCTAQRVSASLADGAWRIQTIHAARAIVM